MKITKTKLTQLIREELEKLVADEPIVANGPIKVKDLPWRKEGYRLWSAIGLDKYSFIKYDWDFEKWKKVVLSHGEGSTITPTTRQGREVWVPAGGPWAAMAYPDRRETWVDRMNTRRGSA